MATQTPVAEAPEREPATTASRRDSPRRVQAAQLLALAAVFAALVGALGPAKPIRTTYSWPPPVLPSGTPRTVWFTPLLLAHRVPESLSADLPCHPRALAGAAGPLTLLATARYPQQRDGLEVTTNGRQLTVRVGSSVLHRVALPARSCLLHLTLANGTWSLSGGAKGLPAAGRVDVMPTVNGLFSEADLRSAARPAVRIAAVPQSARPVLRQTIAWSLAAACALLALLLVAVNPARRRARRGSALGEALRGAHPADAVVLVLLLVWLVLSPANPDDGWVQTTERMFTTSGGFSNYFDALATNLPLAYWLDWLQRWLTVRSTALVVLRLPALACLLGGWVVCRWTLSRVLAARPFGRGATLWALAAMFVVGSFAWDMTLRPEPAIALLTAGVLACAVTFVERQTTLPLAIALVLVALAVTAHPAGIVSLAPLLAAGPAVVRWARTHFSIAATMVPAAIALVITAATVGSDVAHRSTDATTFRTFGDATLSWRDELLRYEYLTYPFFGTPLRRVSVALMGLVVVAYLCRRRRPDERLLDLPARALAIGLGLLVLNPDKLSWHFGTLLALGAVAAATETSRLRGEASGARRASALPFVWLVGAVVVAAWSWPERQYWDSLDLRTLSWTTGFEKSASLTTIAALVPVIALLGAGAVGLARAGRRGMLSAPWRAAAWSVPLVVMPVLLFTVGVLSADAAKTDSWTLTAQNLDALRGRAGCGLADTLVAPVPGSMRPLPLARAHASGTSVPRWVPPAPVRNVPRFPLGPIASGSSRTPWFAVDGRTPLAVLVAGVVGPETKLTLEFARLSGGRARLLESQPLSAGAFQHVSEDAATWLFMTPSASPSGPRQANAARVVLTGSGLSGEALAVTSPVTYVNRPLASTLARARTLTLTNPFVLPYFPCAREPRLGGGIVEAPAALVTFPIYVQNRFSVGRAQTFNGVLDLYQTIRLPLWDSRLGRPNTPLGSGGRPVDLVLYEAVTRIPGAMVARPRVVSST